MCKFQRPLHEVSSSTLGRPDKQSTHYTSRSKSLDRRNAKRVDTHAYNDQWVDADDFIMEREQKKPTTGNNKLCQSEPAGRISSNNGCDTDNGAEANLRYFGDSNIQNYTTMKSRETVNERPPTLASKEGYLHRGNAGTSVDDLEIFRCRNLRPSRIFEKNRKHNVIKNASHNASLSLTLYQKIELFVQGSTILHAISSSGSENAGGRLSSSSGSSRSVYLHAPAVAEIPPSITRTLSRDEINNSSSVSHIW